MKVIIIDDEPIAIKVLETKLHNINDIEIVGKYTDSQMALSDLTHLEVDVAFVDMEMLESHGLEVAEKIGLINPYIEIVFVTAHPQFALKAFEVNAIDYLLKPVDERRLAKTIDKLQRNLRKHRKRQLGEKRRETLFAKVMGEFRLFDWKGNEVTWRTKKVKELFAFLWHHKATGVYRSQIIDGLWPDLPEEKIIALMHTTIYQLRKTIRGDGIENPVGLKNEKYYLEAPVESDLDQLKSILTSKDLNQSMVERMNVLYSGNYLEIEGYEWALPEQEKIKHLYLRCLEDYVLKERARGLSDYFIESCLKKLLLLEPYKMQYIYQLIDFYGQAKDMQKMISLFKKMEDKWTGDLGLDMPREIVEVYSKYIKYE